jgi:uncharacterized membrane protein
MRRAIALTTGLLLGLAAVDTAAADPGAPLRLSCRGEEPFWSLEADGATGRYAEPGAERAMPGRLDALNWLPPGWLVWRGADPRRPLVATLRREACASTMAEGPPMSHRAILVAGDAPTVVGCCTVSAGFDPAAAPLAGPAGKSLDRDWSALLPDLWPGIRRCVADSGIDVAGVPLAAPMNHGFMLARLMDRKGGRHDCIVEVMGGRIDRVDPVAATEQPLLREGNPILLPSPDAPASGGCRSERVPDASPTLVGWLSYRC